MDFTDFAWSFVADEDRGPYDYVYPPDPDYGHLYVVGFDSGWIKVGKTCDWQSRLGSHRRYYSRQYGWSITDTWCSCIVRDHLPGNESGADLTAIEHSLRRFVRSVSDRREMNPFVRGVGRDKSNGRSAETELFHGVDFEVARAYADELALRNADLM
ncbi:hypothetical protein [Nocardia aurantiaca]|uniref:GIY-YIG nuclease family protein n=1 Tax=Nocardia aurantiaca TaxID=2675850 RepID=A0A6I3L9Z2_9NOCA|nr:hypothetical protein [Nocardia aurantiaca]MTE17036.1 hypothetical protein [Nocardia aurantiaca]